MYYEKRYIQFNELVFDGFDMISDYDEPISYKGSSTAYSYGHGAYRPFKNDYLYVNERQVSMTITLKLKKVPCEYRKYYVQFVEQELGKPGKLWAIKNNEILWANAVATSVRPVNSGKKDELVYDIEFAIPGGVWHKADKQKTFVLPYDICSLMDCKGFEDYDPCATSMGGGDCCEACEANKLAEAMRDRCDCCCGDELKPDMALCYHQDKLQAFYSCDTPYQLVYDCEAAEKFSTERALGQRMCADETCDDPIITGRFYSTTDIPTDDVKVTITGSMKNPWIEINGNTNIITGEYDGTLIIESNGDVYYQPCGNECCEPTLLSPSVWVVPKGNDYGWTVYPQINSVIIHLNECCSECGLSCAYIDASSITT